jgi:alkenylglycerophosphocholine hydrolase
VKLWLAFAACVGAFFAAAALGHRSLELAAKPLPVLVLASGVFLLARGPLRRGVAIGLLASAFGDVLLGLDLFLPGLMAFLSAHVAYLVAFLADQKRPAVGRVLPFAAWGAFLLWRLWPALGSLAAPVAFYVVAICAMMWRAAARVGRGSSSGPIAGLLGAVCFGISDSLLAWDLFLTRSGGAFLPVMVFYWLGQAGIAHAALDEEGR